MIRTYWNTVRTFITKHKGWSMVVVVVLVGGAWWTFGHATASGQETRYLLGSVSKQTIISTVSASGQVAANQQLDLKPKVSGQITYVAVKAGDHVKAGALIAEIDPTDAEKAVRDAKANVVSAQLSLQKLQEPATTLTLTQQQNAISQAQQDLTTEYQSSFGDITATFLDLPSIITSLQDIDMGNEASNITQWNIDYYRDQAQKYNPQAVEYRDAAYNDYTAARKSYDQTFSDFKSVSSTPDQQTIEKMLKETHDTTALIATAAKSSYDLVQFYSDQLTQNGATPKPIAATQIANLNSYQTKLQAHLTSLLGDQNNLADDKSSITEKQQTLSQTQQGADTIDLQSSLLSLQQRENALEDANETLADYYIRAPFDATVASVAVNKFDQAGSGTAVATLITPQQLADLSLNEVDAAKIKLGDKATLTFDAIPDLTLTGTVAEIDPVGAVSQGVVSYDVKISFDAQNNQIKSGMTVNADIQSAVQQDALSVPSGAIKTQNGQQYVLAFVPPIASSTIELAGSQGVLPTTPPQQIPVQTGITDDTNTQIVSGLTDGQQIVIRAITGASTSASPAAAAAAKGGFGGAGGGRGGGGFGGGAAIRIP